MLINLRNALMAGKRLPYDSEVEYLQSSGTQYIDTGVVADSDTQIVIGMSLHQISAATVSFGAAGMQINIGKNFSRQYFGTTSDAFVHNDIVTDVRFDLDMDAPMKRVVLNGTAKTINWTTAWTCADAFPLFAFVSGGQVTYRSCRVYSCKIWQNGVLVRDFIPVRKGTVGYMYDRVSGKLFGNAGTGDFVLGPDVVPVEYIESHGTEYINTGIILNDTYGIDINFAPMETASGVSEHGIFGSSVSGSGIRHNVLQIHSSAGGVGLWMPSNTRICNYAITIGEYQHWQINLNDSDEVVIDNVLKAHTHPTTPAECQYPVYLFGRNVANTLKSGSCSKMRLATWMVCDGSGNFIQKGLPVRVGTDATSWEGAMMDVLTRRIYRNAGTGAFGYGNDLKYPIPAE